MSDAAQITTSSTNGRETSFRPPPFDVDAIPLASAPALASAPSVTPKKSAPAIISAPKKKVQASARVDDKPLFDLSGNVPLTPLTSDPRPAPTFLPARPEKVGLEGKEAPAKDPANRGKKRRRERERAAERERKRALEKEGEKSASRPSTPRPAAVPTPSLWEMLTELQTACLEDGLKKLREGAFPFPPDGDPDRAWTFDLTALKQVQPAESIAIPELIPYAKGAKASAGIGGTMF